MTSGGATPASLAPSEGALAVFKNRPFLLLWLAQAATQIGGNMVIFGLTVIISESTGSTTAVSALIFTFLLPAVLFSALAGVFVDRLDRRLVLIATNILRGLAFVAIYFVGDHLGLLYLLNITVSTITVFFGPAEAAMIPKLVPKRQLISANGIFTLTLNAAFAVGFTLLGPLIVKIAGAPALIAVVAALYFVAAVFCWTLPAAPPAPSPAGPQGARGRVREAESAIGEVATQLREGIGFIRDHREVRWSLSYLAIAASLVGVLGVIGPAFAQKTLGLSPADFVVIVLPLGAGIVMGILLLNAYGRLIPRRRVIEGGLIALGVLLALMALSGRISAVLDRTVAGTSLPDLSLLTSLLSIVVAVAFFAGIAYACVAIPSQTQLQEDLPEDVRGRVFGVLNMLVSVASFLPILVVGPIGDLVGPTAVMVIVAGFVVLSGVLSIYFRGPLRAVERDSRASVGNRTDPFIEALGAEVAGPEDFLDEDGDGVPDATGPGAAAKITAAETQAIDARREAESVDGLPAQDLGDGAAAEAGEPARTPVATAETGSDEPVADRTDRDPHAG
ncbi:MAG TPA: MFS transporter [Candidatus Limnocylindrales bacterium]